MRGDITLPFGGQRGFATIMVTVYIRPFSTEEVNAIMDAMTQPHNNHLLSSLLEPHISVTHAWDKQFFQPTGLHGFMLLEKDERQPYALEWREAVWQCHFCGLFWSPGIDEHCISYVFRDTGSLPGAEG